MYYSTEERLMEIRTDKGKLLISKFLKEQELLLEENIDYTIAILKNEQIIGTGSLSDNILKNIAVDPQFQGRGILNKIISNLINEAYFRGHSHLFVYTKPKNKFLFSNLGFYKVSEVDDKLCLMENKSNGIHSYSQELSKKRKQGKIVSSLVMNCNPFTLGHQYIIEKSSYESDIVHVFIVWEDKSSFPSQIRYNLAKEGTKHLPNVIIHKGKDYIISNATFPSYFIKEKNDVVKAHAKLDVEIFKNYIVPALNITKRYIGEEPYCKVTRQYNSIMKNTLPPLGIEVKEIERTKINGEYVSASKVRKLIANKEFTKVKKLLPNTTYDFLTSEQGLKIIPNFNERH